jgi:hypothetical protein
MVQISKKVAFMVSLLIVPIGSFCQGANGNYMRSYKALVPLEGDISVVNDKEKVAEGTTYFDGLGRQVQAVLRQNTPQGYDLINFWIYDAYGRKSKTYLPFGTLKTDGDLKTSAEESQALFYQNLIGVTDGDNAFSVQVFENSALQRVLKQGAPGAAWQPDSDNSYSSHDRTVKSSTATNLYGVGTQYENIVAWTVDRNGLLARAVALPAYTEAGGYYSSGQLTIRKSKDENGYEVREFTDKQGRVILKKVQAVASAVPSDNNHWAQTYYVYDDWGNLVIVLSPEAVKKLVID